MVAIDLISLSTYLYPPLRMAGQCLNWQTEHLHGEPMTLLMAYFLADPDS